MSFDKVYYDNNFNLIRLFASLQVVHYHLISTFQWEISDFHQGVVKFMGLFPGVPIFFFISGYLISRSWEESVSWKVYVIKRVSRIEPALVLSVIFAFFLIFKSGYLAVIGRDVGGYELLKLFLAKVTFFQFYNPGYLREYGDGVLNGSLWTITVELQFYIIFPLVSILLLRGKNSVLVSLVVAFVLFNFLHDILVGCCSSYFLVKLYKVTFFPWFYMFLLGVLAQKNFLLMHKYLAGKFIFIFIFYVLVAKVAALIGVGFGNSMNPLIFTVLGCLVFSAAYTETICLKNRHVRGVDISYGLYLYHMPIFNYFLYSGLQLNYGNSAKVAFCVILVSALSWFCVERPSLSFGKRFSKRII